MLRHVDLCSGIGGFSLAFEEVGLSKTIMFCDTEKWCRDILAKHWPNVPITEDVKELANDPERLVPYCDILTAGYPCQPFSVAGKQRGTEDDRHIWPYIFRIVASKRPTWCVFENVYGHLGMGLDEVLHDLESEGYATRTFIVPASGVGARHKRDRLWIVAHTTGNGCTQWEATGRKGSENQQVQQPSFWSEPVGPSKDVANTEGKQSTPNDNRGEQGAVSKPQQIQPRGSDSGSYVAYTSSKRGSSGLSGQDEGQEGLTEELNNRSHRCGWGQTESIWAVEPDVGRVAHGIPRRMDRLKGLGNAIVPQIAMNIGLAIKEMVDA